MPNPVPWQAVVSWLKPRGAQKLKQDSTRVIFYLPRTDEYAKVVRAGGGYVLTVHPSLAACGCDG